MNDDDIEGAEGIFEEDLEGTAVYDNPDLIDESDENDEGEDEHNSDAEEVAADKLLIANEKISLANKTLKRKEKFEKLKLVKKTKYEEEPNPDISSRSVESMAELIQSSEPIANINASTDDLKLLISAVNFIDPSKSLHAPAKSSCIFVNSIAASVPAFRKALNKDTNSSEDNGSPIVLVVCASAHRSTDVINSMSFGLHCKIAKLFAKHFKVHEQVELLSKTYFPVCVGTPNRLSKLVELGSLSLSRVKVVLIDMGVDEKQFSILTMPGVKEDFYSFLMKCVQPEFSHLKMILVEGKIVEKKLNKDGNEGEVPDSNKKREGKSRFLKEKNFQQKGKFSAIRKGF